MAHFLHRIGAFSVRHRRAVIGGWLLLLVLVGALAMAVREPFTDQFKIPGTASQRASERIEQKLPGTNADAAAGRVVFAAPKGERLTDGTAKAAVAASVKALGGAPDVASASDPFATGAVSKDGRIAYSSLQFAVEEREIEAATTDAIDHATGPAARAGLQVEYGGAAAAAESDPPIGEAVGVVMALIVLSVTFGSLLAAGAPLITAFIAVGFGALAVLVASGVTDVGSTTITLATMLGLAVGVDYTLFILSRHRTQVFDGMDRDASIAHAVGTAGSAVVFAGSTVIIALVALVVTGIPFLIQMGLAAALTIAVAVLLSLTFVPAVMAMAGDRITKGKNFSVQLAPPDRKPTMGTRWIGFVMRHRVASLVTVVVVLLGLAIPATGMRLGLPDDGSSNPDTTERKAYDLLTAGFGPGFNGPLIVAADVPQDRAQQAAKAMATRLGGMEDVAAVTPARLNREKDFAIVQLTPTSSPSSQATEDLVTGIRDDAGAIERQTGARIYVAGQTAANIDVSEKMASALPPYLVVVVGLALLLLMLAFRSILVPVTAIGGFLLTILASFGAVVAVFQEGFLASLFGVATEAPIISLLPVLIIGIVFGLAMDYQVFLVSRMREDYVHGEAPLDAVRDGFRHGARVVTAAALIMISVFAGFILPDDPIIKSIGFAFALGILLDAFLVRMTLIPALMALLGTKAWWLPRWLDRLLPNIDIEGTTLDRHDPRDGRAAASAGSPAD
ncbi:MMPL family transporter [Patulibacter sp. SYSU D01012]|uniref:MMPL family transporter n=1 Tax=Patulibacter sp. SYSU D01012 TaxID=2817381 RepID=UPI001B305836|nr:MMPL family transporter [Patulibacter sp. SYSU D01012]